VSVNLVNNNYRIPSVAFQVSLPSEHLGGYVFAAKPVQSSSSHSMTNAPWATRDLAFKNTQNHLDILPGQTQATGMFYYPGSYYSFDSEKMNTEMKLYPPTIYVRVKMPSEEKGAYFIETKHVLANPHPLKTLHPREEYKNNPSKFFGDYNKIMGSLPIMEGLARTEDIKKTNGVGG